MKNLNEDFLKKSGEIEDNSIPLILTDPPYLIGYKHWDKQDLDFMFKWVDICISKLRDTGSMWVFMAKDNLFTHKNCPMGLVNILQEYGTVHLENWTAWARQKGRGASKHLKSQREEIIHFTKHPTKYTWNPLKTLREVVTPYVKDGRPRGWFLDSDGMRKRWTGLGNVWVYSAPQWNGIVEKQWHPAQKPIMILERLIRLSSNEGDLVLDPFSGSFSTAIACLLAKRDFIGYEINEEYYLKGMERINSFDCTKYKGYNDKTDKEIEKSVL
ncbi:MAG: site-specific DNA-methyltransferase [Novosphingobium sp.]|nr:site-specific DNA-methyltransferase [Novosphingobium sp.]